MDTNKDASNNEKQIEDYLFSGYQPKPLGTSFDDDQQFAQPIEDEDMFGSIECAKGTAQTTPRGSISQMKEKYKELAKNIRPVKSSIDCDEDGMIDFEIEVQKSEPKSNAKLIFEKAALRRVKDKYGLYKGQKLFWDRYSDYLLGKVSADKRKRWESFQNPPDRYNDEEELIDELDEQSRKSESGDENELDELLNDGDDVDQEGDAERMSYAHESEADHYGDGDEWEEEDQENEEDHENEEEETGSFKEEKEESASDEVMENLEDEVSRSPEPDYQKLFADKSKWINDDDDDENETEQNGGDLNGASSNEVANKETDLKVGDSGQADSHRNQDERPSIDDAVDGPDAGSAASDRDEDKEANALDFDELESESDFDDDSNAN